MSESKFTSPEIANTMARVFGNQAKTVPIDIKYRKEANDFARKINNAHKSAARSQHIYK